jgi:hypothetical protein
MCQQALYNLRGISVEVVRIRCGLFLPHYTAIDMAYFQQVSSYPIYSSKIDGLVSIFYP